MQKSSSGYICGSMGRFSCMESGKKVFAVGGWGKANKPAFSFKTSEQNYYFLNAKSGYKPAPYLAARGMKWILVRPQFTRHSIVI